MKSELIVIRHDTSVLRVNVTACNSYAVGNKIYTNSGIYNDTLKNRFGCDSFVLTNLTIRNTSSTTLNKEICENNPYFFKSRYLNKSGTYIDTLKNTYNCDSIVTLNLTVNPTFLSIQEINICLGKSYTFFGVEYSRTGIYKHVLTTAKGCDSIYQLNLTIDSNVNYIFNTICIGDSAFINGKLIKTNISYFDTIILPNGCDSILYVHVKLVDCDSNLECNRMLIPTAFSPNNDMVNDNFLPIIKSEKIRLTNFEIYNRFGTIVYTYTPNSSGWNGTYNEQNVPAGVYTYFVKYNCNGLNYQHAGSIHLVR